MSRKPGDLILHDPSAVEPQGFDWTAYLAELGSAVTISASTWSVPSIDQETATGTIVLVGDTLEIDVTRAAAVRVLCEATGANGNGTFTVEASTDHSNWDVIASGVVAVVDDANYYLLSSGYLYARIRLTAISTNPGPETPVSNDFYLTAPVVDDETPLTLTGPAIVTGSLKTQVTLSLGTLGRRYTVTNHITTSTSVQDERSFRVLVSQR